MKPCKTGRPRVTTIAFAVGFAVATLKLLLAGVTLGGITFGAFEAGDYAAAMAALGAIYVLQRSAGKGRKE